MSRKLIIALVIANEIRGVFSAAYLAGDMRANGWQATPQIWLEAGFLVLIGVAAIWIKKRYKSKA